jgi:peptidoglycan hydrolase-like protein with peptidoglycan-binding domain
MKLNILVATIAAALSAGALAAGDSSPRQSQGAPGSHAQAQTQSQQSQSPEVVKQAQQKLAQKGYEVGAADGQLGPRTQEGVKKFQEQQNLTATGQLDRQTLAALGVSAQGSPSRSPESSSTPGSAPGSSMGGNPGAGGSPGASGTPDRGSTR